MSPALGALCSLLREAAAPLAVDLTALGLAAFAFDRVAARRAWPELRTALWCAVLARPLLAPWPAPWIARALAPAPLAALVPAAPSGAAWSSALALAWLGGALALALALGARERRAAAAALRGARPAPARVAAAVRAAADALGLARAPRVVLGAGPAGPAVVGILSPTVVLPRSLAAPGAAALLAPVLLHELAHVRRRDPLRAACALALACAVFWHPAVWIARRRLALQRELACDRRAAAAGAPRALRAALCTLARPLLAPPAGAAFLGLGAGLVERLRRLERPPRGPAALRAAASAALAVPLLALCLSAPSTLGPARGALLDELPPLAQLPGCLQRRYVVFGLLAEAASPSPFPSLSPEAR